MRFLQLDRLPGAALVSKLYSGFWLGRTCNQQREGVVLLVPKLALAMLMALVPGVAVQNCVEDEEEQKQKEWVEAKPRETVLEKPPAGFLPPLETLQDPAAITPRPIPSA
jgi:hypothetical protein